MSKDEKPDARRFPKVKPGSTLRLEIHTANFCCFTGALTCAQVGELMLMLVAEAALEPIPTTTSRTVQRSFDRRDEYRRIKGGFGRRTLSAETRRAVFERDEGLCRYCATPVAWADYHCDHVEPVSKGGSDEMDNLVAACRPCNLAKAAKPLSEWLH